MRLHQSILLCAATAALVSVGCDSHAHEHYAAPAPTALSGEVSVDEPQGEVISGPGVQVVDVEPDPAQRVYVYDEGYPPGTYTYDNCYYYGGYRYPRDVFVNQYVQENIRQHRYVNTVENREAGTRIEQKQRADFSVNHGVRHAQPGAVQPARPAEQSRDAHPNVERPAEQPHVETPVHQPEADKPAVERPAAQPRVPAPVRPPESEKPALQKPENRTPAGQDRPAAAAPPANRPEQRPNGEHEGEKAAPANESHKAGGEEPKREESK